jgi:hypothetical protein
VNSALKNPRIFKSYLGDEQFLRPHRPQALLGRWLLHLTSWKGGKPEPEKRETGRLRTGAVRGESARA